MSIELPFEVKLPVEDGEQSLWLHSSVTYLIGENGSGKSQLLRSLKSKFEQQPQIIAGKKLKLLSAGRTGNHESSRAIDYVNRGTSNIYYDGANFGGQRSYSELMQDEMFSGVLQNLSARVDLQVKIQERLRKIFCRRVHFNWDHGQLKVYFSSIQGSGKYISSKEASGLMHLVVLLAVIYDDKIGLALLDEPEVSLHPQMQLFILKEIFRTSGVPQEGTNKKLYIIATHSAHMLHIAKTEDILSLIVCCGYNKRILQVERDQGELQNSGVQKMIAHFGLEYKSALFSQRPLLVEGPSDIIICNALAKRYGMPVEAAGGQLLSMAGKGQIPAVVKIFKILGKQPLVLADADAIADDSTLANFVAASFPEFSSIANKDGGHATGQDFIRNTYSKFSHLIENKWNEIEKLAIVHRYFKLFAAKSVIEPGDELKAKRRASFSTLFCYSEAELRSKGVSDEWILLRNSLAKLLEYLEHAGLYILKRGDIESYYPSASDNPDKIYSALSESDNIMTTKDQEQDNTYEECIRFIKAACPRDNIDEATALLDILYAVATPCIEKLKRDDDSESLSSFIESIVGTNADLFEIKKLDDNSGIIVDLKHKTLEVDGFPITIYTSNCTPEYMKSQVSAASDI